MKTSTVIDLVVSLGSGLPYLGSFEVPTRTNTLVISGESGEATIQETMRRVCRSKGIGPEDLEGRVFWGFTLPALGSPVQLAALAKVIRDNAIEVVIIDPLYLCLTTSGKRVDPANLFDMGPLLRKISATCLDVGATPFLVHHFRKNREQRFGLPDMEDLAFAGIQEFARQWVLIGRRQRYESGSGRHELWLTVGGSDGQSGEWAVDVEEGIVDEHFRDRDWNVSIKPGYEIIEQARDNKEAAKTVKELDKAREREEQKLRKLHDQAEAVLSFLKNSTDRRSTAKRLREFIKCNGDRIKEIVDLLMSQGRIRPVESVEVGGLDGKKRSSPGYEFLSDDLPNSTLDNPGRMSCGVQALPLDPPNPVLDGKYPIGVSRPVQG